MAALGVLLALLLAIANKKLYVFEDPRIDQVEELLPKSNCGACGTAGCRNFAEKVVAGEIQPAQCTVNAPQQIVVIADLLGVDAGSVEKRVARLACAGGRHVAYLRARYAGHDSCRAAAVVVSGGGKACAWGCLGLADCANVCTFDAIHMDAHGLPVVDADKCSACNDCVEVCPKGLFSLEPVSRKLWVACKNLADGDTAEKSCEVASSIPASATMDGNTAVIHVRARGQRRRRRLPHHALHPDGRVLGRGGRQGPPQHLRPAADLHRARRRARRRGASPPACR
jgi:electron transport complex protein RnfB